MRILLLGELSGLHQELAPALRAIGHDVTVAHSALARDDFPSAIPFYRAPTGASGVGVWLRQIASQLRHAPKLGGHDIVQIVTPKFFNWKIHGVMLRYLKRHNRKLVIITTSCSSDYHRRVAELAYRPCKECLQFDLKADFCIYDRPDERRAEYLAYDLADAIVATSYEYGLALNDTRFATKIAAIPLPIDTDRHRPSRMKPLDKVRIWYGETRYGFKGSAFILPALERLAAGSLAGRVEIIRSGRLAFDDYCDTLSKVHIVVDQASSYGMGMNALYALARGRVTLTGAEPEALDFLGVPANECPAINIKPDVDQIHATLAGLVVRKGEITGLGQRSAAFVARYHASSVIAARYISLYQQLLEPVSAEFSASA